MHIEALYSILNGIFCSPADLLQKSGYTTMHSIMPTLDKIFFTMNEIALSGSDYEIKSYY
jgi:hypothetical protein